MHLLRKWAVAFAIVAVAASCTTANASKEQPRQAEGPTAAELRWEATKRVEDVALLNRVDLWNRTVLWNNVATWNYVVAANYAAAVERAHAEEAARAAAAAAAAARAVADRPRPRPAPVAAAPRPAAGGGGAGGFFACTRNIESGGNYAVNTGNGYYGAYQFDLGTWRSVGGSGLPSDASPAEQDARAATLYAQRGNQPWGGRC